MNKAKLLVRRQVHDSKLLWWLGKVLWNTRDEIGQVEKQSAASRKGKSMYSYNEVHKENSREIVVKIWGWRAAAQLLQKKIQKLTNQIQTNKSRNGFKLPVKTLDLEIRRVSVSEDEDLKWLSNRCKSRILPGFKMENNNFWQGVIRGGCRNIVPVWVIQELPCFSFASL